MDELKTSTIQINYDELMTILTGLASTISLQQEKIDEHKQALTNIHKYKDGFESTVKEWIADKEANISELHAFHKELISRFVSGSK